MTASAAKVLHLAGRTPVKLDDGPATIALCQRAIRTTSMKYIEIASAAGVCPMTVSNIAYGDTKFPRMATVIRILMALGWVVYASDDNGRS